MITARKSILMLCSWFPNKVQPANGNFVEKHVRIIAKDHQVQVLQVEHDPQLTSGQENWVEQKQDQYHVLTIYFGSNGGRIQKLFSRLRFFQAGFQYLSQQAKTFDLVHVHVAMPAVLIARYWQLRYRVPFVMSCHASGFLSISPNQYPWWQRQLLVFASSTAHCIMPVSQALADAWLKNGSKAPISVIPNVVNTNLFRPASASPPYPPVRILHISNFHPQAKNVAGILRVAQRLVSAGFPFQLTIAGDGDLNTVKAYAKHLELPAEQVILQGALSEAQVADMMQSHHIFLLFSNYETQGVTLLEAQCCGLAVIGTRVGGIPEIIDQEWKGILVNASDEEALFEAIKEKAAVLVAAASKEKISRAAQKRYGEAGIGIAFNTVYQNILDS